MDKNIISVANNLFFEEVELLLNARKEVCFHVCGNSMFPFLRHGDKVVLVSLGESRVSKGSIVLAHASFGWVLHRVLSVLGEKILLAGDANARQVESVEKRDVIGVVIRAYRNNVPVSLHSWTMRGIVFLWCWLRPFRGVLLAIWHVCKLEKTLK